MNAYIPITGNSLNMRTLRTVTGMSWTAGDTTRLASHMDLWITSSSSARGRQHR